MTSIRWRLPLLFILLLFLAMQGVGVYLLQTLESYYLNSYAEGINERGHLLASFLAGLLPDQSEADLNRFIREFGRDAGVDVSVLDRQGLVLTTSGDPTLVGQRLTGTEVEAALGGERAQVVRAAEGVRRLVVAFPISGLVGQVQGAVHMSASLDEIYAILQEARGATYVASLVALLVAGALASLVSGTITGPIQEVTSRAAQMARGDFDQRISIRSADEIGQLAAMFNVLTGKVRETLGEISSEKTKLEAVLSHMADGIIALDAEGNVTVLNHAAANMLGTPEHAAMGHAPAQLWPQLPLDAAIRDTMTGGDDVLLRFTIDPKTGERRGSQLAVRAQLAALRDGSGQLTGLVIVLQDVTEEEQLESLRREFVANVSHELRTPLTAVKSYVETLLDGAAEDEELRERFLGVIASESDRMARLVSDLLDLSQIGYEGSRWPRGAFPLLRLIDETVSRLEPQAQRAGVALEVRGRPVAVHGNRDRVQQVLVNLLANAIEFTPSGGRVWVDVAAGSGEAVVTVADTGIGIPSEDMGRVFERFYRVDKGRSRRVDGGTGLGLSIAREIVEAHGGRIWIDSGPEGGTAVTFTLPLGPGGSS